MRQTLAITIQRRQFLEASVRGACVLAHDIMFAVIQKLYLTYGSGEFDGQGSGHDFYGTLYHPPTGYVNNCDGGRSHLACDVSFIFFVVVDAF